MTEHHRLPHCLCRATLHSKSTAGPEASKCMQCLVPVCSALVQSSTRPSAHQWTMLGKELSTGVVNMGLGEPADLHLPTCQPRSCPCQKATSRPQ